MKSDHAIMDEQKVRRWTGAFGIATLIGFLAALPLYFLGPSAPLPQDSGFTEFVAKTSSFIVARATLADPIILSCFLVFVAGLRHLIKEARSDYEWISTLVFGTGLLYITLQLVADALEGAGALDTVARADQTAVRALFEGSVPLYSSVGLIPEAFFFVFAGYAILATGILPKWTGWMAYVGAVLTFADAPTIYFGFGGLTSGVLGLIAAIAEFWLPVWFIPASILLLRKAVPTPNH